jgi:hypothetical protein
MIARRSADGFVQIGALAGLAVVAGIVTLALSFSLGFQRNTATFERSAFGAMAADSGIRRLIASIEHPADTLAASVGVTGTAYPFELSGLPMTLAIEGEAGKLDPLTVERPLLESYVRNTLLPAADVTLLFSQLDIARGTHDGTRAMELLEKYLAPALSPEDLARDFTSRAGLAGIDPMYASERVLRALPDLDPAAVDEILRRRTTEPSVVQAFYSRYFSRGVRPEFTLVATVDRDERHAVVRRVPVEMTTAGRVLVLDGFR